MKMRAGHAYLVAILSFEALVSIRSVPNAAAEEDLARPGKQERVINSKTDYAAAAEAAQNAIARAPRSVEAWTKWADLDLERFRILELELRSGQIGMAVVLRLEAQGLHSGPETREELLRQSATAGPELPGIFGELGVEQVRRGMREEAATTLKTALARQSRDSWTLRLEALIAAEQDNWREAESKLLELGGRSPAMLRKELQTWPKDLVPPEDIAGEIWECVRKNSAGCLDKIRFSGSKVQESEDRLFAEERWEQLAALPQPPSEAAWFRRGIAIAELSDCARAIPALERGLGAGLETAAYWLELCYASEAERAAARIGALGNQAASHRVRADFLVRVKGDVQGAAGEYEKARKLQPRDAVLAERLAQAYMSLGDMQRTQKAAKEALALDPQRPIALRLLASIAMNEREYPDALVVLKQLLNRNSNDSWARVQMGIAYAQTGQPEQALACLQPVLAAGYPDERGALHGMLAGVLRKLGRNEEAQAAAAEANRLSDLFQQHGQKSVDDHY